MPRSELPRHLAMALNLRGIGVYDPQDPPDRAFFTWLARKHQYRNVGFAPPLMNHPAVDVEGYQTFRAAGCPVAGLEGLAESTDAGPGWVVGSLLAASAYVAPLFIHRPALPALEPFVVAKQESARDLPEDQVMRHCRIAGFGMLDCYTERTTAAYEALVDGDLAAEQAARATFAEEDAAERFWRLEEEVSGDAWVGGYFDALPAFAAADVGEALEAEPDTQVGLGLVGGFAVDPPYD